MKQTRHRLHTPALYITERVTSWIWSVSPAGRSLIADELLAVTDRSCTNQDDREERGTGGCDMTGARLASSREVEQVLGERGPAVDLEQQLGQAHQRQHPDEGLADLLRKRRDLHRLQSLQGEPAALHPNLGVGGESIGHGESGLVHVVFQAGNKRGPVARQPPLGEP